LAVLNCVFLLCAVHNLSTWPGSISLVLPKDRVAVIHDAAVGNERYEVKVPLTDVLFRASQTGRLDFLCASSISVLLLLAILYVVSREFKSERAHAHQEHVRAAGDCSDARDRLVVTPERRLRWYQYSLATLLMLMLVTSLAMSCWAVKMQRVKRRKEWIEDKRYNWVPILDPLARGGSAGEPGPPSEDEVMRAVEIEMPAEDHWPLRFVDRIDVHIVVQPLTNFIDPPRVYPLVGPAQLHHVHYSCVAHFTDATRVAAPLALTTSVADREYLVYIDHDHLHRVEKSDPSTGTK
jgi:hypothetical protein